MEVLVAVSPFRIAVPDAELADLRDRLRRTRWPEAETADEPGEPVEDPLGSSPRHRPPLTAKGQRAGEAVEHHGDRVGDAELL
jgi:hypothetical protein